MWLELKSSQYLLMTVRCMVDLSACAAPSSREDLGPAGGYGNRPTSGDSDWLCIERREVSNFSQSVLHVRSFLTLFFFCRSLYDY